MSGHSWDDDTCELCGDKDWYADKYCSGNPAVADKRAEGLKEQATKDTEVGVASNVCP